MSTAETCHLCRPLVVGGLERAVFIEGVRSQFVADAQLVGVWYRLPHFPHGYGRMRFQAQRCLQLLSRAEQCNRLFLSQHG